MEFWKELSLMKKIVIIIVTAFIIILLIPESQEARLRREQQAKEKQQREEEKNNPIKKEERKPKESRITVTRSDLGEDFPLTVDKCELYCEGDMLFCYADGTTYALNGTARQKRPAIDPIWAQDPDNPEAKKSIDPLISIARKTCK